MNSTWYIYYNMYDVQLKSEIKDADVAQQFLSTVATSDSVVANRPMDSPTNIELLEYIIQAEIRSMAKLGRDCGKLEIF